MTKKPYNIIWVSRRNPDNKVLAVADSYEEVNEQGRKKLKDGETHYLRTYAEISEGDILCERQHCYRNHFNFCPHCGGKLNYREDEWEG